MLHSSLSSSSSLSSIFCGFAGGGDSTGGGRDEDAPAMPLYSKPKLLKLTSPYHYCTGVSSSKRAILSSNDSISRLSSPLKAMGKLGVASSSECIFLSLIW
jgi:hypothetical protein